MDKIKKLRLEVDEVDEKIMDLLHRRFALTDEILGEKKVLSLGSFDGERENQILEAARRRSEAVEEVYRELLRISKERI